MKYIVVFFSFLAGCGWFVVDDVAPPPPTPSIEYVCWDGVQSVIRVQDPDNFEGCANRDAQGVLLLDANGQPTIDLNCVKMIGVWAAMTMTSKDGANKMHTVVVTIANACGGLLGDFAFDLRAAVAPDGSGRWCALWALNEGPAKQVWSDCVADK